MTKTKADRWRERKLRKMNLGLRFKISRLVWEINEICIRSIS